MRSKLAFAGLVFAAVVASAPTAEAQNPQFQNFFFNVCQGSPSGALAARCGETTGGLGDLSGDSEDSLNPSQFLEGNQASQARARVTTKDVQQRLESKRGADSGAPRWGLFGHFNLESLDRDATALQRGFDSDRSGVQIGADYRLSDRAFVGALLSVENTDTEFDPDAAGTNFTPATNDGAADADGISLTVYGSRSLGATMWIDGSLGVGQTDYEFARNAVFQESTRSVAQTDLAGLGSADGDEFSAGIGFGHDYTRDAFSGGAYVRANFTQTDVDRFVESDAAATGLAMDVAERTRRSMIATLGWRGSYTFSTDWGVVLPQLRIELERELEDDPDSVDASYVLDTAQSVFTLAGDSPDESWVNAALGVMIVAPNGWSLFVDGELLTGHDYLDRQRFTIGARKEF